MNGKKRAIALIAITSALLTGCAVKCPFCEEGKEKGHLFHTVMEIDANTGKAIER